MSITGELRKWNDETTILPITRRQLLDAIADRIDAEHEAQLKDAFETRNSDENQENDGWVRGPLDADGVMWHEGDMSDSWGEIERIMRAVDGSWYVMGHDVSAPWVRADSMRHHREPTVEDVLDEFASAYDRIGGEDEEHQKYLDLIAEYAAKLQLKERK